MYYTNLIKNNEVININQIFITKFGFNQKIKKYLKKYNRFKKVQ